MGTEQAEQLKQEMFEDIVSTFTNISNTEEIQACIEQIIKYIENVLPINERETIDIMREAIKESLYDIIQRLVLILTIRY